MKRNIKKLTAGILAAAVVFSSGTASAFAARPGCGRNFVDADGDGVCDCRQTDCRFIDKDQDGICDNCDREKTSGHGKGFTDADGDGVCDHKKTPQGNGFRGGRNKQQVKKCGANKR